MKPIHSRKTRLARNIFWLMILGQLIGLGGFIKNHEHNHYPLLLNLFRILLMGFVVFLILTLLYLLLLGLIRLFSRISKKNKF